MPRREGGFERFDRGALDQRNGPAEDDMRRRDENKNGDLERLLAEAWRNPGEIDPGPSWNASVMRSIRSIAAAGGEESVYNGFSRLVFRVSMATAAIGAVLAGWTLARGITPLRDLALAVLEDPASLFVSPPFV